MIVILFLDDNKGMMFNHRRQSRDRAVTERIQEICKGKNIWMSTYSDKLYGNMEGIDAVVTDDFLALASSGDYCLVESERLAPFIEKIERIVVFGWNRTYPADVHLDLELAHWQKKDQCEFQGFSHEKITETIYERKFE